MNPIDMIPVFRGKKREYNLMILETLIIKHALTSWQLAKELYKISKKNRDVHNIYSVIVRKNGRLDELLSKEYITETENNKWAVSYKGVLTLLIVKPEYYKKIHPDYFLDEFDDKLHFPETIEADWSGIKIKLEGFSKYKEKFEKFSAFWLSPNGISFQAEKAKNLVKEGINLDMIDNYRLVHLVTINSYTEISKKYGFNVPLPPFLK